MKKAHIALLSIAFLLTACASNRLIDSQVNAFAPQRVPAGSSYRFERLPSQENSAVQDELEAFADHALAEVGFRREDRSATYSVQVSATRRGQYYTLDQPTFGWSLGWIFGNGGIAVGDGSLFPGLDARPNYAYEVGLIVRERASQTVVFETRATHDGPWSDSAQILPAMLQAALQGFPAPPEGVRRVNIEIPR